MKPAYEIYLENQHHGFSPRALLIPDEDVHTRRLAAALKALKQLPNHQIIDLGCGFGHLAASLPASVDYIGVDMLDWMIAKAEIDHPDRQFVHTDVLAYLRRQPDRSLGTICCLGVAATMEPQEVRRLLSQCRRTARHGLVFSFQATGLYKGRLMTNRLSVLEEWAGAHAHGTFQVDTETTAFWKFG